MFTGLVQTIGRVVSAEPTSVGRRLILCAHELWEHAGERGICLGDSVCVTGACLTVVEADRSQGLLTFDVIHESLKKTKLGDLATDTQVNLELALTAQQPLGGHFVQGHVDGQGVVTAIDQADGAYKIAITSKSVVVDQTLVPQGSVTVDGVSLTLADVEGNCFAVALIPETLERTTLSALQVGDTVNLEGDFLAKMLLAQFQRWQGNVTTPSSADSQSSGVTMELLRERGFLKGDS